MNIDQQGIPKKNLNITSNIRRSSFYLHLEYILTFYVQPRHMKDIEH